ncbi:MAG: phage antirepressor KilAC domain-containing protein [Paraclostridium sp.]
MQIDLFNQELVKEKNGELLVSSLVIAENVSYEHRAVIQLINSYKIDFEELGALHLKCIGTNGTNTYKTWYDLNENQVTFLLQLMKNNEYTVKFKLTLTKAFSMMKSKLQENTFLIPKTFSEALLLASKQAEQIEKQNQLLLEQKPKVDFFEAVTGSKDTIDIGTVAKVLNKKIGRNKLFEILRDKNILMASNMPYQKFIDCGYFRVIETKYNKPDGSTHIGFKTLVYQKGVNYINKLIGA